MWLTDEVRRDRPSVLDEVSSVIWYLEDRLLDATSRRRSETERAFRDVFGRELGVPLRLSLGSWVARRPRRQPVRDPGDHHGRRAPHGHALLARLPQAASTI